MDQKSYFGTIRYYDTKLFKSKLCEPSMLFLLGLEAILTPSDEYISKVPVIDPETEKQMIDPETDEPIFEDKPNEERLNMLILYKNRIGESPFKNAYFYLYDEFPDDSVSEIKYDCYSLKAQLNEITGTESNRICPIIYHWNFDDYPNLDIESQKIELSKIFNYAGYCKKDNNVKYVGKFGIDDLDRLDEIDATNKSIKELHEEKKLYSQKYKLLDYKAMYSYALGVLYGCWCLGYSNNDVFTSDDPSSWYRGEYTDLVQTASLICSFHYKQPICCIDGDPRLFIKYKGIPTNKIWNLHSQDSDDMADRLFYIDGSWLTYEQAHSLGYSVLPQRLITFYTVNNTSVVIKQDSGDNTYYDSENRRWVADFADLNLYKKVKSNILFRGESSEEYSCYTSSINDKSYTHIFYNSLIRSTNYTYENYGITAYPCENIIADDSDSPIIWFDASTNKYFDDRDGIHRWVDSLSDIRVTLYDSLLNTEKEIYEDDTNNRFFYDNAFISRDDFYSHDNYGIIRETIFLFKDSLSYEAYYDSYSNEYCIPNVTDIWLRKEDLFELGYSFVGGTDDLWLGDDLSRLPWK